MMRFLLLLFMCFANASEYWRTSSGIPVIWQHESNVPMQEILITFNLGSRDFKPGHLKLMTDSMDKGSRYFSKESLKQLLYNQGIVFEKVFDRDNFSLYYKTPIATENSQLIRVLDASALTPIFPYNEVRQAAVQQHDFLKQSLSSLDDISISITLKLLFPKAPRYAAHFLGQGEEIKYIHPADLKIIHKNIFRQNHAKIILIGALSKEKAKDLAEKIYYEIKNMIFDPKIILAE